MERLTTAFEVKELSEKDDKFFIFEGLASTFGNIDLVDDVVDKGAFANSLALRMPKVLWQHDTAEPIGMPEQIMETEQGLFIRARLPKDDSFVSGRVIPQLKVGSISSMSIGFTVKEFDVDEGIRHLKEVDLFEVSLVSFPANTKAEVTGFKNLTIDDLKEIKTRKEYSQFLKGSGLFSKQAREFLASQFVPLGNPDDGLGNLGLTDDIKKLTNDLKERLAT